MAKEFYIVLDRPRKLMFRYKDVGDAVAASGKPLMEMLGDEFSGWRTLLFFGLRYNDSRLQPSDIGSMVDTFIERRLSEGAAAPMNEIGIYLMDALEASGFIKRDRNKDGDEGNAPAPMAESGTTT